MDVLFVNHAGFPLQARALFGQPLLDEVLHRIADLNQVVTGLGSTEWVLIDSLQGEVFARKQYYSVKFTTKSSAEKSLPHIQAPGQ